MNQQVREMRERLDFIQRTIDQAAHACGSDREISLELKKVVSQLEQHSSRTRQALEAYDAEAVRARLDALARMSEQAQSTIGPEGNVDFAVKSAVILTHIEVAALKQRLK